MAGIWGNLTPIYRMERILGVFGMDKGDLGDGGRWGLMQRRKEIPTGAGMTVVKMPE